MCIDVYVQAERTKQVEWGMGLHFSWLAFQVRAISPLFFLLGDDKPESRRLKRNYREFVERSALDRRKNGSSITMDGSLNGLEKRETKDQTHVRRLAGN